MNLNKEELKGWDHHVKIYSSLSAKNDEKSNKLLIKSENTLKSLDKKRKKLSRLLINNKYCKNMTGSKSLTSDYDLTLFLKSDDTSLMDKFLGIINHYQNNNIDISKVFDMNLYFCEILCDKINPKIKEYFYLRKINSLKCGHKHLFINVNEDIYSIQLQFIMLKYIQNGLPTNKLKYNFSNTKKLQKELSSNIKNDNLSTLYNLQCNKIKELHNVFDKCNVQNQKININDIKLFTRILCESRFYSVEAYYCQSTMNVVVYNITLGVNLLLNKYDHYLSIIENWFDLYFHLNDDYCSINLLKYSKYLYRIYYSWNELIKLKVKNNFMNDTDITNKLKVLKKLIKKRSDYSNIDKYTMDLDYVYINKKKLFSIMTDQINFLLKKDNQNK